METFFNDVFFNDEIYYIAEKTNESEIFKQIPSIKYTIMHLFVHCRNFNIETGT